MGRKPTAWYREQRDLWCTTIDSERIPLVKGKDNKDEAEARLRELLSARDVGKLAGRKTTVAALFDEFLEWTRKHRKESTYSWYKIFLQDFVSNYGRRKATDILPIHLSKWVAKHDWNDTTERGAISAIQTVMNFGVRQKIIPSHHLEHIEKPRARSRSGIVDDEEFNRLVTETDECFADFLRALRFSIARPGEIRILQWSQIDLEAGIAVLSEHKTERTGKPRVILITEAMKKLILKHQDNGSPFVFLNSRGKQWTTNAVRLRMSRLRKRLGIDGVVATTVRHTAITEALRREVPIATVAQLAGHSTTRMIDSVYGHLGLKMHYLKEAAERATGEDVEDG